jgi:hypothetical protein
MCWVKYVGKTKSTVVLQLTLIRVPLSPDLKLALALGFVSVESSVTNALIGHLTQDNLGLVCIAMQERDYAVGML